MIIILVLLLHTFFIVFEVIFFFKTKKSGVALIQLSLILHYRRRVFSYQFYIHVFFFPMLYSWWITSFYSYCLYFFNLISVFFLNVAVLILFLTLNDSFKYSWQSIKGLRLKRAYLWGGLPPPSTPRVNALSTWIKYLKS